MAKATATATKGKTTKIKTTTSRKRPAKETAPTRATTSPQAGARIDVPVEFGGVSIGDGTARLGVRIMRDVLDLDMADDLFCGHRLTGTVAVGNGRDAAGQGLLWDDLIYHLGGTFDVKRLGVSPKHFAIGLTFSLEDIQAENLTHFAKRTGRLAIQDSGPIPEGEVTAAAVRGPDDGDEDDGDDSEDLTDL